MKLSQFEAYLLQHVPLNLAEVWDNVGLLIGRRGSSIHRVMTTLDVTAATLQEAIAGRADLILTHHPLPFHATKRITDDDLAGELICTALQNQIQIYSLHTAWDNAEGGINDQLANLLKLECVEAIVPAKSTSPGAEKAGSGRCGRFSTPVSLSDLVGRLSSSIDAIQPRSNVSMSHVVKTVGICCGSGGSMLSKFVERQSTGQRIDVLVTGEATYHQCLEAAAYGIAILMLGHHCSERFAMQNLASKIKEWMPGIECWASLSDQNVITR